MSNFVDFVHLHNHSMYSTYDGMQSIESMVAKAKELNFRGIALTDHGKVAGLLKLYKECKENEINPILGIEAYYTDNVNEKGKTYHLTILAKNNEGYKNILNLSTISHKHMYRGKPRVDFNMLNNHKDGLIILSGCIASKFSNLILNDKFKESKEFLYDFKSIWGDDFYVEVMDTGYAPQLKTLKYGMEFAKDLGIKCLCTNDAHYTCKSEGEYQGIRKAISNGKPLRDGEHDEVNYSYYLKTYDEMLSVFGESNKTLLTNTVEVSEKCDVSIKFNQTFLPSFEAPKDNEKFNEFKKNKDLIPEEECYLMFLGEEGLKRKGLYDKPGYKERLYKEIETIKFTGFTKYFLIVEDYCSFARKVSTDDPILIGSGRGSGVGSLVLNSLGVTGIDPIEFGLTMDRFLYCEADYRAYKDGFGFD